MDPAKLKVVELRAELSARGLDTKGNKPVLVKRLREALEAESGENLPDTSIVDTSTEDFNVSTTSSQEVADSKETEREKTPEPTPPAESPSPPKSRSRTRRASDRTDNTKRDEVAAVTSASMEEKNETANTPVEKVPEEAVKTVEETPMEVVTEPFNNSQSHDENNEVEDVSQSDGTPMEVEAAEKIDQETTEPAKPAEVEAEPEKEVAEPRSNRKSRWGSMVESTEPAISDSNVQMSESTAENSTPTVETTTTTTTSSTTSGDQLRGEKRRHSSPSPERSQRKRSRSPIKDDEPEINSEHVQLSWIDSDLNLQVNKETFTIAEPMHNDGFGYMWAGVRSTHGIQTGKVWYEVKLLENCGWKKDDRDKERDRNKERERRDRKSEDRIKKNEEAKPEDVVMEKKEADGGTKKPEEEEAAAEKDKSETPGKDQSETTEKNQSEAMEKDQSETTEKDKLETVEKVQSETVEKDKSETVEKDKSETTEKDKSETTEKKDEVEKDNKKEDDTQKSSEKEKKQEVPEVVHTLRVGWSLPTTDLQLGEQKYSYAFDSEGFTVTDSQFTEFGKSFAAGDVVGTFLDMETETITISYTINGELQPTAFTILRSELPENATMFPHILTRNIKFEVNFGQKEEPWFQPPSEIASDYKMLKNAEEKVAGIVRPSTRQECEVVMMVGLPCSGKTYWVNNHVEKNVDKHYNVLGLTSILDKMKYRGKSRKEYFKGSLTVLMDKCTRCLGKLVDLASTRRRNYILDQTNLFSSAQRRKLRPFEGFRRQAVVIVVTDDEQSSREKSRQQADGKDVPDSAVLEMKANMCLPSVCDWLDEVTYAELDETKSKEFVQKYNKQGREAGYGPNYTAKQHHSNNQRNNRRGQWSNNRNNKRDSSRESRNRWGGGSSGSGGGHRPNNWAGSGGRGGSGWNRHDNRNHHHGGGGGGYRNSSSSRMVPSSGGGYNRSQGRDGGSGGGYNRNRNQPPHSRNSGGKGGNWGGQGGGSWSQSGNWGGQGGWGGGHQSGGQGGGGGSGSGNWGNWSQYGGGGNQGGGGGNQTQQWKSGYNAQYQQQYPQGYAGQYGGQYANWNYYGEYAQNWNAQSQSSSGSGSDNVSSTTQYNQYTQQQQAAWAQYTQSGCGYGGQTQTPQGGNTVSGSGTTTGSGSGSGSQSQSASK